MDKEYAKFLIKKTSRDYNLISGGFSRARDKAWEEMGFLFDDYIEEKDKVLDIGCGNGRFYELMKNKNVEYFGVDNSKEIIALAKQKYPDLDFLVSDGIKIPFSDEYFDKVFAISVLHHIPSAFFRKFFINEVKRVLKPNGIAVFSVWDLWGNKVRKKEIIRTALEKILKGSDLDFGDVLIDWHGSENCYFHGFRKRGLKKLIQKKDFKVIKRGSIAVGKNHNLFVVAQKKRQK